MVSRIGPAGAKRTDEIRSCGASFSFTGELVKKKKKKRKSRQYSLSVIGYSDYVFNTVFVTFAVVNAVSAVCVWR